MELLANSQIDMPQIGDNPVLGFEIKSFEDSFQTISENGVPIIGEVCETPKFKWFTIKDPDGMHINLFQRKRG